MGTNNLAVGCGRSASFPGHGPFDALCSLLPVGHVHNFCCSAGQTRRVPAMDAIDDMEFEWDEKEQQFLRVFLGKILKRPYAAAWNTWLEMVHLKIV